MDSIDVSAMDIDALKELRDKISVILDGPNSGMSSIDDAVKELKAVKERVAAMGRTAITKAVKSFMEANPEVLSLRWTQYTPYFNDGDSCEFSVRSPEVSIEGADEDGGDNEDGYMDSFSLGYYADQDGKPKPEKLMAELSDLESIMTEAEDAMKATFGDHVQVTISRGSDEAEIEEYEHD